MENLGKMIGKLSEFCSIENLNNNLLNLNAASSPDKSFVQEQQYV